MILFLLVFFFLYSALHAYVLSRFCLAFSCRGKRLFVLSSFMFVMVISPVLVRLFERAGIVGPAKILAVISFSWMGFVFLFVSLSLLTDCFRLFRTVLQFVMPVQALRTPANTGKVFVGIFVLSLLIWCYGWFEAGNIQTSHVVVHTKKLPEHLNKLRLVQISDVHLGLLIGPSRLETILDKVNESRPDILVCTGDMVDGHIEKRKELLQMLRKVKAPFGKYAVTGNHEFYVGVSSSVSFLEEAGFTVLRGGKNDLPGNVGIFGADDHVSFRMEQTTGISEELLLRNRDRKRFNILLKHRPNLLFSAEGFFDLQMSGHIHQGQIFPFGLITRIFYPQPVGLSSPEQNRFLYVSRGTGTWGPPIRFLSPPEVTVIDIVAQSSLTAPVS
jgi:uncharacterized protein